MTTDPKKKRVLFVCLGNICRSPAAQGVMQAIVDAAGLTGSFEIDSAGTAAYHIGELPDKRMRIHASRRGLSLTHRARRVEAADFNRFDMIVAMDESNFRTLRQLSPSAEADARIHRMAEFFGPSTREWHSHVPDPYYEGAEGFELVLDLLDEGCRNLFESLKTIPQQ